MIKLYAEYFGIGDADIAEAPWLIDWIKRNHNNLKYCDNTFKFYWK